MASLFRVGARQTCRIFAANATRQRQFLQPSCLISTSKKNKDSATVDPNADNPLPYKSFAESEARDEKDENWISFGYHFTDREMDRWAKNLTLFCGITIAICWGGFIIAYMPDHRMKDWFQREAYLELARREKEGLPLVDAELIPVENIQLPSDEELGDTEIVV